MLLDPAFVDLHAERPEQPLAALGVRKDPDDMGSAFELLVDALKHIGGFQVLVVRRRIAVEGEGFLDV